MSNKSPWQRTQTVGAHELLSDELFTKLDQAHSSIRDVSLFLARLSAFQHEAAQLAQISEELVSFTKQ